MTMVVAGAIEKVTKMLLTGTLNWAFFQRLRTMSPCPGCLSSISGSSSTRFLKVFAVLFVTTSFSSMPMMFHGNLVNATASSRRSSLWNSLRAAILPYALRALSALNW